MPSGAASAFCLPAAAIAFAFAANPLPRGSGAFLGRARAAVVGLLAAAAAFGAYDLETLYPGAAWRRPTNSPLVYGGLFAIVVGELLAMLGLGGDHVRLPLTPATEGTRTRLKEALAGAGVGR